MKKTIIFVLTIFIYGCSSYFHLTKDEFLQQAANYKDKSKAITSFSTFTPYATFSFSSRYDANKIEKLLCWNEKNELVYLYPDKNTQLEITSKSSKEIVKMYFDTVFFKDDKLIGLRSRLITSMTRKININDIEKIEIYTEFPNTEKISNN